MAHGQRKNRIRRHQAGRHRVVEEALEHAANLARLGPEGIDLNFGCPAKVVNRHGGGASLLQDPEQIGRVVEAVRQTGAPLVGLSALMTTTVPNMQATIEALHAANLPCKVMVGGAVLTKAYAEQIGADFYAKDAKASADYAKQIFG